VPVVGGGKMKVKKSAAYIAPNPPMGVQNKIYKDILLVKNE
jgi:hypothetical protein